MEKQSRLAGDAASNTKILVQVATLCYEAGDLAELEASLGMLSKKRGLIKGAMAALVQKCIEWIPSIPDRQKRHQLIAAVREATEGKIYLEVERARVTRILADIYENEEHKVATAAHLMQELQVETFGSLEKRAKVDFILEQMRLSIAVKEYSKASLISRKVTSRTFDNPAFEDLKLRYLELVITLAIHDERYLDCYRHYRDVFASPSVQASDERALGALKMCVVFAILAPYTPEQKTMLSLLAREKRLEELPLYGDFLKTFLTNELVRWPVVEKAFGEELRAFPHLFGAGAGEAGVRWRHLAERVVEHNVRTISAYYGRITLPRLATLLERTPEEAEATLCSLVEKRMVYGRIDRILGIVNFTPVMQPDVLLNSWSQKVDQLLAIMVKTNYQISKEEMLHHSASAQPA